METSQTIENLALCLCSPLMHHVLLLLEMEDKYGGTNDHIHSHHGRFLGCPFMFISLVPQ